MARHKGGLPSDGLGANISKRFSADTAAGVTASCQSSRNFSVNFLQFIARHRRARAAIFRAVAPNQTALCPVLRPIFN
jgi:hypothetical protein